MSVQDTPLVSVIICVYNAGRYLRPSVESILGQTWRNLELIVVDDGSTDGCLESLHDLNDSRVVRLQQPNSGKPTALNRALSVVRGDFYAIQDADDLSYPERIQTLVDCMLRHPHLAAVFSGYDLILNDRRLAPRFREKDESDCRRQIELFSMPSHDPTVMYRTALVRDISFDPDLPVVEGLDHILRVGERHPMRVVGQCLYSYRIHPHQVTRKDPACRHRLALEVKKRACLRRGIPLTPDVRNMDAASFDSSIIDNGLATHFLESAADLRANNRYREAILVALAGIRLRPASPSYYKALAYALMPKAIVDNLRSRNVRA